MAENMVHFQVKHMKMNLMKSFKLIGKYKGEFRLKLKFPYDVKFKLN